MIRRIHCLKCGWQPIDNEDAVMDWHQRIVRIKAHKPASHGIQINSEPKIELPSIMCDLCNERIQDGTEALAITMYRGDEEPRDWEGEYGEIL